MPRAINIKATGAGTKEVEYTVLPSPKETPVSEEVLAELAKKPTPEEIIELIKGKSKPVDYPESEITQEDSPL